MVWLFIVVVDRKYILFVVIESSVVSVMASISFTFVVLLVSFIIILFPAVLRFRKRSDVF